MPVTIALTLVLLLPHIAAAETRPNVNSIDCAFVRGLNAIERLYLIKKFALTEAEIRAIKRRHRRLSACGRHRRGAGCCAELNSAPGRMPGKSSTSQVNT